MDENRDSEKASREIAISIATERARVRRSEQQ